MARRAKIDNFIEILFIRKLLMSLSVKIYKLVVMPEVLNRASTLRQAQGDFACHGELVEP
jgi:hypothetical protein